MWSDERVQEILAEIDHVNHMANDDERAAYFGLDRETFQMWHDWALWEKFITVDEVSPPLLGPLVVESAHEASSRGKAAHPSAFDQAEHQTERERIKALRGY